jgi:Transport and Golgi organisation 2
MCTLSVIPTTLGIRVVFNRDERRDRLPAFPASTHELARRRAVYPVDPVGTGTWIGVNDRGMVAAVLNRTPGFALPAAGGTRSRGLIVPAVLSMDDFDAAVTAASRIDPTQYALFRLLVLRGRRAVVFVSDGRRVSSAAADVTRPLLLTSSSLGDKVVAGPRARLFRALMETHRSRWPTAQQDFHDHQWPLRPEVSVRMERSDARTVSRTVIDVSGDDIRLSYEPVFDIALNQAA